MFLDLHGFEKLVSSIKSALDFKADKSEIEETKAQIVAGDNAVRDSMSKADSDLRMLVTKLDIRIDNLIDGQIETDDQLMEKLDQIGIELNQKFGTDIKNLSDLVDSNNIAINTKVDTNVTNINKRIDSIVNSVNIEQIQKNTANLNEINRILVEFNTANNAY